MTMMTRKERMMKTRMIRLVGREQHHRTEQVAQTRERNEITRVIKTQSTQSEATGSKQFRE
jgi:hypothetical protein